MERRIKLDSGQQRKLVLSASKKFGSLKNLSNFLNISYSTLKKYGQEKLLLPEELFTRVLELSEISKSALNIRCLSEFWWTSAAGRKGIKALRIKYPDKFKEWRREGYRKFPLVHLKPIKIPKLDERLAELIGVYIGDGTITPYLIRISGDKRYDFTYYNYLSNLLLDLFGIRSKIKAIYSTNQLYLEVHSKGVCNYFFNLGIKFGDKIRNKTIIPREITKDKKLCLACIRGLIDTDGSVSKDGGLFSIRFGSHNPYLLKQIKTLNKNLNLFTFASSAQIGTRSKEKVFDYFKRVGSSNLRHVIRFIEFKNGNVISSRDIPSYYDKYKKINLPFRLNEPVV